MTATTTIHPFCGCYYDPSRVCLSDVVTQPYDRFDDQMKAECLARSPHNLAHILLPQADYGEVRPTFDRWIGDGVLRRDQAPGFYGYEQQTQAGQRRRGVFALVSVLPYGAGAVLPHERTLSPPREDRLRYLAQTGLNAGSVFFVYNDPEYRAERVLDRVMDGTPPLLEAADYMGETHRVWRITESDDQEVIRAALAGKTLYIADGHHRYEAALQHGSSDRLGTLFNMAGDLAIWATHRLVRAETAIDSDDLRARLSDEFEVRPVEGDVVVALEEAAGVRFVLVLTDGTYLLQTRDQAASGARIPAEGSDRWKQLDVNILQHRILTHLLGITAEQIAAHEKIDFMRGEEAAIAAVGSGTHSAAFLLLPTPLETVTTLANQGERMPQKSTDFYPKVLSGLVMHQQLETT